MDKIATTKRAVQHKAWAEMYAAYQESGKTVSEWCSEQGIVTKTFYYQLRKFREVATLVFAALAGATAAFYYKTKSDKIKRYKAFIILDIKATFSVATLVPLIYLLN